MFWDQVVGQKPILRALQEAIRRGRVSHAYLFSGPAGMGKKAAALGLGQSLNCLEPRQGRACGECPACRKTAAGAHPDVTLVEPEGARLKIDQVRGLARELALRPYEGRYRVVILDQVERLTDEAANSLLKVLEEPPGHAVLVLLATEPERLLPTILSRCQQYLFRPVAEEVLAEHLQAAGHTRSLEEARFLAALTGGNPGQAETLAAHEELRELREGVVGVLEAVLSREDWQLLELAERWERREVEGYDLFDLLGLLLQDIQHLKVLGEEARLHFGDRVDVLQGLAAHFDLSSLSRARGAVLEAERAVESFVSRRLTTEVLLLKLKKLGEKRTIVDESPAFGVDI